LEFSRTCGNKGEAKTDIVAVASVVSRK